MCTYMQYVLYTQCSEVWQQVKLGLMGCSRQRAYNSTKE